MRRSDGEYRWIAVTGIALQNKDKSIRELVGTFSDITLRMQAEETIRLREAMLRGILNNLQDAYLRTDHAGRLIMASPSAARMFSYESNETMIGIPAADLYDNRKDREVLLEKLGENGQVLDWVVPAKRKDGNKLWISINVQFIHDENGQIAGTEGVVRDVTDRIQLEQQLYKAKEKLREEKIYLENEINRQNRRDRPSPRRNWHWQRTGRARPSSPEQQGTKSFYKNELCCDSHRPAGERIVWRGEGRLHWR
jgi:PAS domain S-box-containing protein